MTTYKPGAIVLIPFPFTDLSTFKQRPAVVLSSTRFNRRSGDIVIAAITSHPESKRSHHVYRLTPTEQEAAGLPKPSIIKLGKVVTIDQRLVRKHIGALLPETMTNIFREFYAIFGRSEQ